VDEIGRTGSFDCVPTLFQALNGARFGKLLARKDEGYFSAFIAQRHPVGKGAFSGHPANVHAERLVDPGTSDIKILVT
jgi:hypothetical protein